MDEELSILVIGRDPDLFNALSLRLKPCGYSLRNALSARDALNCLKDHTFDLAVLSLQLPDAHGICLLAIMKRLYPRLPVVILSADESTETMVKALRLGAKGYLFLPIELGQLLYCIDETLKPRQTELRIRSRKKLGRVRPRRIYRGILNDIEEEI
jgi:DNA-binding NtrC family response regulator